MNRYSATIADHFEDPRNRYVMQDADAIGSSNMGGRPPSVTMYIDVDDSRIVKASFQAFGCGFLIACCSILTELAPTLSLPDNLAFQPQDLIKALEGLPQDKHFCALLAVEALHDAIRKQLDPRDSNHDS